MKMLLLDLSLFLLVIRGKALPIHRDGTNVRSYLYCEDVAEAFEKERRVNDVAKDICKLFDKDPEVNIKFVENRPFNDQRYFLDDVKLKILGWSESTTWEELLKKTMMLMMMPGGRLSDGSEENSGAVS
ncbi:unnamed protein product [Brassica rapa]|uniref:NAD-dependent epimerase/dehydratase domain-containing protein n=1 Tax=Brassica campestris TaxID=3711 RepID=A0A3P5Y8S0_BRACM|nr:unnamed protein product [Brassica rapa]VDC63826.1 unnamed protein product [Brassica rapa]